MANGTPTFTNPNWHEFQPSQIETSLANAVDDPSRPSAFPMLMGYKAQRQGAAQDYTNQISAMHDAQMQEFLANNRLAQGTQFLTGLKDATQPSHVGMLQQLGIIPQGMDTSGLVRDLTNATNATNLEKGGRGIGSMATGGITGLTPSIQGLAPGAVQGVNPLMGAAGINAAGRTGAALIAANNKPIGTVNHGIGNGDFITGSIHNGQMPEGVLTSLGIAPSSQTPRPSTGVSGDNMKSPSASPLAGNPTANAAATQQSLNAQAIKTVNGLRSKGDPDSINAARDILDAGQKNGNQYKILSGNLVGSSGKLYPMAGN
jgi:hypothetical protein